MRDWLVGMRRGLVELCVLAALREGEAYGYEILRKLGRAESLGISESTVYPVLARLAEERMVRARAMPSPNGPPRRYYRLTPLGETRLTEMAACWKQMGFAVEELLKGADDEPSEPAVERRRRTAHPSAPGRN